MSYKHFIYLSIATYLVVFCEYNQRAIPSDFKFNFEQDQELNLINWKCNTLFSLSDSIAMDGQKSLKVTFFPGESEPYPGFRMSKFQRNWHQKDTLILNVFNPAKDSVTLNLRIDDSEYPVFADRYNKSFRLAFGWTDIRLPLCSLVTSGTSRVLSSKDIQSLILFFSHLQKKQTLYFDRFYIGKANGN